MRLPGINFIINEILNFNQAADGHRVPFQAERSITRVSSPASPPVVECQHAQLSINTTSPASWQCE